MVFFLTKANEEIRIEKDMSLIPRSPTSPPCDLRKFLDSSVSQLFHIYYNGNTNNNEQVYWKYLNDIII